MDAYSAERYSYSHAPNAPYPADHAANHLDGAAYGLHYDYMSQPMYPHVAYTEPMYTQSQPVADYSFPPSIPASAPTAPPDVTYHSEVPLHAPVPLSPYSTLISPISPLPANDGPAPPHPEPARAHVKADSPTAPPPEAPSAPALSQGNPSATINGNAAPVTAEQSPLEYYGNAPQVMFPTPSELLTELNAREASGSGASSSRKSSTSAPQGSPPAQVAPANAKAAKVKTDDDASVVPKQQPETQRKAYFRRVAEAIGFAPTDPDTITSHDKKRSYLECLEQYVQWLHEQIRLVGHEPVPLERVQDQGPNRGPSSRSIRTLLVHMEDEIRELHLQTMEDERAYLDLQMQVEMQQASAGAYQLRRHSVAACGYPDAAALPPGPFLQPYPAPAANQHVHAQY